MKIAMLTNAYPYYPGEQFIEDEIAFWADDPFASVTLLPAVAAGEPRSIPDGVSIDLCLASGTRIDRFWFMLLAMFSSMFRHELIYLWRSRKMGIYTTLRAMLHTSKVLEQAERLEQYAKASGKIDVAYCYWNEAQSYAALLAKARGSVRKVVSRAHGFDLYETRRKHEYMPLKRQFIHAYDRIFTLSDEGKAYLEDTYGAPPEKMKISPLGVPLANALSRPSPAGSLHVASVSFCVPVKRLDRIVEALSLFARQHGQIKTTWTHIGGGPLFDEIRKLAETRLAGISNLSFEFLGELPNQAVKTYYLDTPVDLFMNTSESEGMGVSIMEAMSAGVPALAPDVGGVSSLVSNECGALLSPCPSSQEIADAIGRVALEDGRNALRMNARKVIEARFSSNRNYTDFISNVLAIGSAPE
ncbi:glycosyltransferase [Rhodanobacter terrae]|uniref:Glycosyltransferase n=1 Tax=Rhodanobacter terrae TaxID=418647 RepID=A0ABW0ST13_9GAMM